MGLFKDVRKLGNTIALARRAFGDYKWQIVLLVVLGFLSGLFEGIGINSLIPLFSFVIGENSGESDAISRVIQEIFTFFHLAFNVKFLLIFIALLFILKAVVLVIFSYLSAIITLNYEQTARNRLFGNFLNSDWGYLLRQKLGHLEKILMVNVRAGSSLLGHISSGIMIVASLIVYITVAVNISWFITTITLLIGGIMLLIFKPVIRKINRLSGTEEALNRKISHHINENIIGMKTVKVMDAVERVIDMGKEYFDRIREIQKKTAFLSISASALMQPISILLILVVFAFYYKNPNFNLAALAAIIYLIKQIFNYFDQLQKNLISLNSYAPYLGVILDKEKETTSFKEVSQGERAFNFKKSLEFLEVSFSYEGGRSVLEKINLKIDKGEMVGLIGPSGGGKTTLSDLILRLFNPTEGRIILDGVNIEEISFKEWHKNIGYVSQDIFLMNDTIANNIRFYDRDLTDNEIAEAARMADIYDFIENCPKKFETVIGERGVMLSGGQRQRIVIARVLARKPKILILDEATSALDNESEAEIKKVIENLKGRITVLVIAHRLSTVMNSDRLLIMENGRILEEGSPKELLKNKETYFYKVYNMKS